MCKKENEKKYRLCSIEQYSTCWKEFAVIILSTIWWIKISALLVSVVMWSTDALSTKVTIDLIQFFWGFHEYLLEPISSCNKSRLLITLSNTSCCKPSLCDTDWLPACRVMTCCRNSVFLASWLVGFMVDDPSGWLDSLTSVLPEDGGVGNRGWLLSVSKSEKKVSIFTNIHQHVSSPTVNILANGQC